MSEETIIEQAIAFVRRMRPGEIKVFPFRLSSEERKSVLRVLRRDGLRHVGFGLNPTAEGGGTSVYRPSRRRR